MRSIEGIGRLLRRTDVRSVSVITLILLVVIALQNVALYAYIRIEALEEADAWVAHALHVVARDIEAGEDPAESIHDIETALGGSPAAIRFMEGEAVVARWGEWPAKVHIGRVVSGDDGRTRGDLPLLAAEGYLVATQSLPGDRSVAVALPVRHFSDEAEEVGFGLLLISVSSVVLALLIAVGATVWAFKPLRDATRMLAEVSASEPNKRLPWRGTRDPVDRHAQHLNALLAEIDAAFARLRAFSSDVAHELRTPLNRMATVADTAACESENDARAALDTIQVTVRELTRMVDALLLMSELDSGTAKLVLEYIDVGARISDATKLFAPAFEDSGRRLCVEVDPVAAEVVPELFDRVIFNLLENELRHTEAGCRIDVLCQARDGGYRVIVQDDGKGFAQTDLETVFDRFTRGPRRSGAGHGLGLAIARTIAELHGGTIRAEAVQSGGARLVWEMPTTPPTESAG